MDDGRQKQRKGILPSKTKEGEGQESTHRAQSFQAAAKQNPDTANPKRIKWPPFNNKGEWQRFDEDICEILRSTTGGEADSRLKSMTTIIVNIASERFRQAESKQNKKHTATTAELEKYLN